MISVRLREEQGFTLVEIMIVMVVLGILAGFVLFAAMPFQSAADDAKATADADTCKTASAVALATVASDTANSFLEGGTGC
jgi:prepilin-type N-terminal cleavage/methylation domain-containing protein